ncbi:MAG TPA: PDZ domain-containing protein [Polyangiaceae bacterium LLY-WYZ-15_(1-7)]|nr:PDZ domain-containing protein [Polyangiaceae bacterium LLY-WYZ-15_(1-7)]HJL09726.1 PDZ domain-containing protein [Polyangiaceae bacterium LLY-WYZ-15_(1-7)]HJL25167.1 PDZ domain-containing protein [Polyangiaceae bacterium LLY-WYZ-15_(1-7)]HJL30342.1 PDZ domain-containing protein [Polyangiaceae bacterium LLY-WYZ-15_(1-7)]HJL38854.1 PDZ domain-containing protein [Polyangiaceae bacterium LLY-WYZ-15_(1-7)]
MQSSAFILSSPIPTLVLSASAAATLAFLASGSVTLALGPQHFAAAPLRSLSAPTADAASAPPLCRNVFDRSGSLCVSAPPPDPPGPATSPTTCEGVGLRGIWHDPADPAASRALVEGAVLRPGDTLGAWEVDAIDPGSVWLATGQARCRLALFAPPPAPRLAAPPVPSSPRAPALAQPALPALAPAAPGAPVQVSERVLDALRRDPMRHLGRVRLVPRDGGLALYGLRRADLLAQAGFRNGDVLRAIDGHPLASMDDLLGAYAAFADAREVAVELIRGGAPRTIRLQRSGSR